MRSKLIDNGEKELIGIYWKSKSTNKPNKSLQLGEFLFRSNSQMIQFIYLQYVEVKLENKLISYIQN